MKRLLVGLALAGCAQAGRGNSIIGGTADAGDPGVDASILPEPDATLIDAPPAQLTLTQTATNAIMANNSIHCEPGDPTENRTVANSYYRVFVLADYSVTATFHVTEVVFGIQSATSGSGANQTATLRLGTYGIAPQDPLDVAQIRGLTSVDIKIPNGNLTRMPVQITADVPATTNLIVELAIPEDDAVANDFFIGTNREGERQLGYWRAPPTCAPDPTSFNQVVENFALHESHIVMDVTGTQ